VRRAAGWSSAAGRVSAEDVGVTAVPPLSPPSYAPLLPGSIEQYLTTEVPVCRPDDRVADVRADLVERRYDSVDDVAVCEDGPDRPYRLSGLVPVETLLAADGGTPVRDLMDADPPVVAPGLDQEMAAWKAVRRGEFSLAVVDAEGRFRGLVPPARLLGVLLREHDEDLARLGGYLSSTDSARHATDEPLGPRLWHRVPWLLLGLLGSRSPPGSSAASRTRSRPTCDWRSSSPGSSTWPTPSVRRRRPW
jgi:magnesium transporter